MLQNLQGHWGFTRLPFGRDLAPSMLHRHNGHSEAAARITWAVTERALALVTGEVGVGKTVAVRAALARQGLDQARHVVIYLGNPTVGARGIHHAIVTTLGQAPRFHTATLIPQATDALATEYAERGRVPVLVIDEAHLLSHPQLEALRMLTNHNMDSGALFACLLVGGDTLFSDDAIALIHQTSRGYPRAVNNVAIQALLAAFAEGKAIVDEHSTRTAVTEVTTE
jgi:type II secretory pathway predicted ATPase ExeA